MENCCRTNSNHKKGFGRGLFYGLIPHVFCIAFLVLSLIGAAGGAALAKKFLLIPYFFLFLMIISLLLATLTAFFYLKKNSCCDVQGIRSRRKYLFTLYAATIVTNILVAYVIIPAFTVRPTKAVENSGKQLARTAINVQLPCPGHAPLIIDEVRKSGGVETVTFQLPDAFQISYDPQITSPEKLAALEIFKTFKIKFN
ncbi:MAG: hypothetical protein WC458_03390 [Patescibacteria group bacterium]|jgi:hypothetical protein